MKNIWFLGLVLFTGSHTWAKDNNAEPYFSDCGRIEEIPGDVTTRAPWTAAIYIRPLDSESPRFFTTGTIIGPTTVLTISRGAFGSSFRGTSSNLPPPESFFVVAGTNSTDFKHGDPHLQKSEVIFLEPDTSEDEDQENDYHFMLFHLKTILKFRTPYVRALCLLPLHWDFYQEITPFGHHLNSSGFAVTSSNEPRIAELRTDEILTLSKEECTSTFTYYYKRKLNPDYTYCGVKSRAYEAENFTSVRVVKPAWDETNFRFGDGKALEGFEKRESCFLHGAVNTVLIQGKSYLAGMLALIPGKRQRICNDGNLYYYARSNKNLAWLHQSVHCSPNKFACGDPANTCLPLSNVCNGQSDCPGNGRDEHQIFCEMSNQCSGNSSGLLAMYSCGLNGDCIQKSQVCDGTLDCLEGNDESPEQCRRLFVNPVNSSTEGQKCLKFQTPKGVIGSCRGKPGGELENCGDVLEPGTEMEMSCAPYHTSSYAYSSLNLICDGASRKWRNRKPFSCAAECGIVPESEQAERNLPWNVGIGELGSLQTEVVYKCSAVLIDESFILTAASCVKDQPPGPFHIILEPTTLDLGLSGLFADGYTQIVHSQKIWYPKWFTGESVDLALVKIDRVLTNDKGQGAPVCYLNSARTFKRLSRLNTTGKVLHIKEKLDTSGTLKEVILTSEFPLTPRSDCIEFLKFPSLPSYVFCGAALGESLLPSDVGAGLYILEKNPWTGSMQMHLKGIVVTSQVKLHNNTADWGQLFINTDYFINWVTDVMSKNYAHD